MTVQNATRELAERVVAIRYEDLDEQTRQAAGDCFMDWVGCALAGAADPGPVIARSTIGERSRGVTLVGSQARADVAEAAMCNAFSAHSVELDDVHLPSLSHVSAPVVATALAVGEEVSAPSREVCAAVVAGYEVMAEIGRPVGAAMINDFHVHPTGFLGYFGAAAAAAKLYQLDAPRAAAALGIAGGQAGGLTEVRGTMSKAFFAGHAAAGGTRAAQLAARGFTSAQDIVSGPAGVWASFGAPDHRLGPSGPAILENTFKIHASCAMGHAMINAVLAATRAPDFPADFAVLEVRMSPEAASYLDRPDPRTPLDAKFSAQFCAAVAWRDGAVGLHQFDEHHLGDPALRRLMDQVSVVGDDVLDLEEAEARALGGGGEVIATSHGRIDETVTAAMLRDKFAALTSWALGEEQARAIASAVSNWPQTDPPEITSLLGASGTATEVLR